jgi:hypothetical protein
MRRLFDSPDLARELGDRARSRIATVGDVHRSAEWFTDRFSELTGVEVGRTLSNTPVPSA